MLYSCGIEKKEEVIVPNTLLNQDEMITVLTDYYLAEGATSLNIKQSASNQMDSVYGFNPLKDHLITKSKFDSSVVFYSNHPVVLKLIYDKVLERLGKIQNDGKL